MDKNLEYKPNISVVMSVYNGESYLAEAINSILNQTYKDFEFIIVNDGSTDNTLNIIKSYKDPRIKIINQGNQGLVASLNSAIKSSRGEIIVRQDADDISLPDRLFLQINRFNKNKDLAIIGSSIITIDESTNILNTHKVLLNDPELKQELLIRSPFAHGSVMFKKDFFYKAGCYKKEDWPAEDYGLWVRLALFGKFANIDEPLYKYRENNQGISSKNHDKQRQKTKEIQNKAWGIYKIITGKKTHIANYRKLNMGEYRIERISYNYLRAIEESVKRFNIFAAIRLIAVVISDKILLRKCVRIAAIKLKLKHV
jgi:glycosyltransferase involved in cell wall biosynthesis